MTTMKNLQVDIDGVVEKFNPNHKPAGTPEGGQFTTADGDSGGNVKLMAKRGESLTSFSDDELIENHIDAHSVVFIKQGFEKNRKALKPDPDVIKGIEQEFINRGLLPKNIIQLRAQAKRALNSGGSVRFIGIGEKGASGVMRKNIEGTFDVFEGKKLSGTFNKADMNFILNINKIRSVKDATEKTTTKAELQAEIDGVVEKFNPYHDPANGQFTTAGGAGGVTVGKIKSQKDPLPFSDVASVTDTGKTDEYDRRILKDEHGEFTTSTPETEEFFDQKMAQFSATLKSNNEELEITRAKIDGLSTRIEDAVVRRVQRSGGRVLGDGQDARRIASGLREQRKDLEVRVTQLKTNADSLHSQRTKIILDFQVESAKLTPRIITTPEGKRIVTTKAELQAEIDGVVDEINEKLNPNRVRAGAAEGKGGQFGTSSGGAGRGGARRKKRQRDEDDDKETEASASEEEDDGKTAAERRAEARGARRRKR